MIKKGDRQMLTAQKLLPRGYYLFYDDKYLVAVSSHTKIYDRTNLKKEILSVKTQYAYWGMFLSDEEILIKSTDGHYWFIDIVKQTSRRIFPVPRKQYGTGARPVVDPGQGFLFDFTQDDCVSVLQKIGFDGTSREQYRLPVYGSSKLFRTSESVLVITNSRGMNEITTENRHELRRIEFNVQTGKVEHEERCEVPIPSIYKDLDFAILWDGSIIRYNGEQLNVLNSEGLAKPLGAVHPQRFETNILCLMPGDRVRFYNLQNPSTYKEVMVPYPDYVVHYEDKLLFCTWEGVYQILYKEVFP